jgi:hypothetical protein
LRFYGSQTSDGMGSKRQSSTADTRLLGPVRQVVLARLPPYLTYGALIYQGSRANPRYQRSGTPCGQTVSEAVLKECGPKNYTNFRFGLNRHSLALAPATFSRSESTHIQILLLSLKLPSTHRFALLHSQHPKQTTSLIFVCSFCFTINHSPLPSQQPPPIKHDS